MDTQFTSYLKSIINIPLLEEDMLSICASFSSIHYPKNSFLVEAGDICPYFYFIKSGILQHTLIISGEEKTTYLALKNSCTTALNSFKNQVPSRKSIKAISTCHLYQIPLTDFDNLLKNNKVFYNFYYNLIENQIFLIDDYRIDLLTLSPEERYQKMLSNEPTLLQQVPLRYLASFLGISTRHMSRIRKNAI